jgi:hypothetical protein
MLANGLPLRLPACGGPHGSNHWLHNKDHQGLMSKSLHEDNKMHMDAVETNEVY